MLAAATSQLEKEHDHWFALVTPCGKRLSQVVLYEKEINLRKAGCCQGSEKSLRE
jgi:hypothetical protein